MKLTGYYMTAICKFEDGIKTICVVDAQNRAQMLERLKAAYPEQPFKLYDFVRTKFSANVQSADVVDIRNLLHLQGCSSLFAGCSKGVNLCRTSITS